MNGEWFRFGHTLPVKAKICPFTIMTGAMDRQSQLYNTTKI